MSKILLVNYLQLHRLRKTCINSRNVKCWATPGTFEADFPVRHSFPVYSWRAALPFPSTRGIALPSCLSFSFIRLSFIYLPLVINAISPLIWDGLTPPSSHPSPAPAMTRSPCSPGPLTSLHPHPHLLPHLLTSPAVAWPSPLIHSLKNFTAC